jgi:hypothetical protein
MKAHAPKETRLMLQGYSGFRIAVPKGNTLKSTRPQGAATSQ